MDDCTPDNSVAILKRMVKDDARFTILRHEKNGGLSAARNTGTKAAKGEYVYYLDSDDEITPVCIEALVKLAEKYPKAEIIQGSTRSIPEEGVDWRDINTKHDYPEYTEDRDWIVRHFYALENFIPVNAWNKLVKRDWINQAGDNLYFCEGIIHEDERWLFDVVENVSAIAFSKEITYLHYQTEGSIMTNRTKSNYKSVWSMAHITNEGVEYMRGENRLYKQVYLTDLAVERYLTISPGTQVMECATPYRKALCKLLRKVLEKRQWYLAWTIGITILCPLALRKGVRYIKRVNLSQLPDYQKKY